MTDRNDSLAISLFSEIFMADQLARNRISRALPRGMELSHFSVLNHLARLNEERTPAQLAAAFHVTRGAMTNTLNRLDWAGHVHIRPDWDDARRKLVSISPAGRSACDAAIQAIAPVLAEAVADIGEDRLRAALPVLRLLRQKLEGGR
ncbi:MarR family winged helix-turn-helix transcriptional regulator [Rhodovulum adriaticum]|uniref:MarR family transcriptional regulator n=1 Tax=Rhodovulum adriaticum TaxID=35804 RepID=A0A4R2P0X3_RHOAD|nr:MarR family transcriptional regulator [Rhodovulum adriaticum]MBK1636118.1 MarR family transcriptional regulator [Rhodovulum adriaticum]TCP27501.1 MarR family transcriptional regulator [Rhodovulum adriaticum]